MRRFYRGCAFASGGINGIRRNGARGAHSAINNGRYGSRGLVCREIVHVGLIKTVVSDDWRGLVSVEVESVFERMNESE